ncbi:hypothetical protein R1flu_001007 [Riccia fluitans]|uniref:Tubby C-terminal domain-containing protein n=1 Tax=Riccia fluitans TaxID=41844 RepID=A0ABD1Y228_9MARC
MSPDHSRPVPGVLQPHRIDPRDDIAGIFEPAPKDRLVQCFIIKDPLTRSYCLFLQLNKQLSTVTNRGKFLMAARPIVSMSYSEFMICGDLEDLTEESELYYGRLRSNLSRNEYCLWDCRESIRRRNRTSCWPQSSGGLKSGSVKVADVGYNMTFGKPQKFECSVHTVRYYEAQCDVPRSSASDTVDETATEPTDILSTNYVRSSNLLRDVSQSLAKSIAAGAGQMSKSDVTIDEFLQSVAEPWSSSDSLKSTRCSSESSSSLKSFSSASAQDQSIKSDTSPRSSLRKTLSRSSLKKMGEAKVGDGVVDVPLMLRTRLYTWDKTCKRYYADFNRGDIPGSAKNFQLVAANHGQSENDKILLQFGQAGQEIFFMDYRYPLTAFEAFGICLTRLS